MTRLTVLFVLLAVFLPLPLDSKYSDKPARWNRSRRQAPIGILNPPIPTSVAHYLGTNQQIDKCPRDQALFSDGNCYPLLTQGPCTVNQYILLDPTSNKPYCAERLCAPDRIFIFSDQLCHDPRNSQLCPPGRELYETMFGTPICQCPTGTYEGDDDLDDDVCDPLLGQTLTCPPGQVFWFRDFSLPPECLPDPCGGDNLNRGPNDQPFVPFSDGRCFQLGTMPNVCPAQTWYAIALERLQGVCTSLEEAGYQVFDEVTLQQIIDIYGPPIARDATSPIPTSGSSGTVTPAGGAGAPIPPGSSIGSVNQGGLGSGISPGGISTGGQGTLIQGPGAGSQGTLTGGPGTGGQGTSGVARPSSQGTFSGFSGSSSQGTIGGGSGNQGISSSGGQGTFSQGTSTGGSALGGQSVLSQGTQAGGFGTGNQGTFSQGVGSTSQGTFGQGINTGSQGTLGQGSSTGSQGSFGPGIGANNQVGFGQGTVTGSQGTIGQGISPSSQGTFGQGIDTGSQGAFGQGSSTGSQGSFGQGIGAFNQGGFGQGTVTGSQGTFGQGISPSSQGTFGQGTGAGSSQGNFGQSLGTTSQGSFGQPASGRPIIFPGSSSNPGFSPRPVSPFGGSTGGSLPSPGSPSLNINKGYPSSVSRDDQSLERFEFDDDIPGFRTSGYGQISSVVGDAGDFDIREGRLLADIDVAPTGSSSQDVSLLQAPPGHKLHGFFNSVRTLVNSGPHNRSRRASLPHSSPGNVFETRLVGCRAGAQRDTNAKCRDTVLPPRTPASRPARAAPPVPPRPGCPSGQAFNIRRMCEATGSAVKSVNRFSLG